MDDLSRQMLSSLASLIEAETGALSVKLPREYSYKSLPMALVDAVFSIGVKYRAVENTVERFCLYQSPGWARYRWEPGTEHTIGDFLETVSSFEPDVLARTVYGNRQRTSASNGILKAEAVTLCAQICERHGVLRFADASRLHTGPELERNFRAMPGQGSGLSFSYLKMLCGDEEGIKLDRHIRAFMSIVGVSNVTQLREIAAELEISARQLDYAIWQKMSRYVS